MTASGKGAEQNVQRQYNGMLGANAAMLLVGAGTSSWYSAFLMAFLAAADLVFARRSRGQGYGGWWWFPLLAVAALVAGLANLVAAPWLRPLAYGGLGVAVVALAAQLLQARRGR